MEVYLANAPEGFGHVPKALCQTSTRHEPYESTPYICRKPVKRCETTSNYGRAFRQVRGSCNHDRKLEKAVA